MNAKMYLIVYYSIAGVIISLFTAVMTYLIIGVPIGQKMIFQIFLTILATLPIIGILSYLIGDCLSRRLAAISHCLNDINEDKFLTDKHEESITDISMIHDSIHQLSDRLQESISNLKNSNQQLNNMILSLSHDIKTPLSIIEGYLEELEDDMVTEEQKPAVLAILKKETAYINELSSEVIHYLQSLESESQKVTIPLKTFLHDEVCPLVRVPDSVDLYCEIEDNASVLFDVIGLKNILVNLVHNATKHTTIGYIKVIACGSTIVVEDTGIGIDLKVSEMIFEPFFCVDQSKNREKSGFGLGLSIARNIADTNGYRLQLDLNYTNGSRFLLVKKLEED
jgi:two-component system sensor histidine kinase SaeS